MKHALAEGRWTYPPNLVLEQGGRHRVEVVAARTVDEHYGVEHDSERVA